MLPWEKRSALFSYGPPVVFALIHTYLYLSLIASYWRYYDMGSGGGNGFALMFLYLPVSLTVLASSGVLVWVLLTRRGVRGWLASVALISIMLALILGGVVSERTRTLNYPTDVQTPFAEFLKLHVRRTLGL